MKRYRWSNIRFTSIIATLACLMFILQARAAALTELSDQNSDDSIALLDQYFQKLTEIGKFNGVLLVQRNQNVLIRKAYNHREFPSWSRVTTESQFHIASVRKLFNRYISEERAPKGLLDKRLSDYVNVKNMHPEWTLRLLLDHKSGLPRGEKFDFNQSTYTEQELRSLISNLALRTPPNTEVYYSNYGYLLADLALADWFKVSVKDLMQSQLLGPLRMNSTFSAHRLNNHSMRAKGMYKEDKILREAPFDFYLQFPSGDIFSTVDDLNLFLRASRQGNSEDVLGNSKPFIVEHAGAKRGYRSYVFYESAMDLSLVFLSNFSEMPIAQVIQDSKAIIKGRTVALPQKIERKKGVFQKTVANDLVGQYLLEVNGQRLDIQCVGDRLYLLEYKKDGTEKTEVFFEEANRLFFDPTKEDSILIKKSDGQTEIYLTGMGGMEFKLKKSTIGQSCQKN